MSHGGKRPGSGRPRKLTELQRLAIGGWCERLYRELLADNERRAISEATKEIRKEHEKIKKVHSKHWAIWEDKEKGKVKFGERFDPTLTSKGRARAIWLEIEKTLPDYRDDVSFGMETDYENHPVIRVNRPYGVRQYILERVCEKASQTFGCEIGKDTVDDCWKGFRALTRELLDEESDS